MKTYFGIQNGKGERDEGGERDRERERKRKERNEEKRRERERERESVMSSLFPTFFSSMHI